MGSRFGALSHITLNRPKIYCVLKMSLKAGMVQFVVVKSAGSSNLWILKVILNILKKSLQKIMCSLFGNTFRWGLVLYRDQSNWTAVWINWLFSVWYDFLLNNFGADFNMLCLNIVNNCKQIYLFFIVFFLMFFTIYYMSQ